MNYSTNRIKFLAHLVLGVFIACLTPLGYHKNRPSSSAITDGGANSTSTGQRSIKAEGEINQPTIRSVRYEADQPTKERLLEAYGNLPLSFEANHGQANPEVKFISRGRGYTLLLAPTEAVLSLSGASARKSSEVSLAAHKITERLAERPSGAVLRMRLLNANPEPQVRGIDNLPGKTNYFIGNDPDNWRTGVPNYAKVEYEEIYPGVNLVYYGNQQQLEYDFVVAPGADPGVIKLGFEGARQMRLDAEGDLVLRTSGGEIRQRRPIIYQVVDGNRQEVSGSYVLKSNYQVGFQVGNYDADKPLVIDPVLAYSTYFGGSAGETITVDSYGYAYVIGNVSTGLPNLSTPNAYKAAFIGGDSDAFVMKLNTTGSALVYSTYLGGEAADGGSEIVVNSSGDAYLMGLTKSTDFPKVNPLQPAYGGGNTDCYVAKLNAAGSALLYSTYLGGSEGDLPSGLAVDSSGDIYITGGTSSPNFPLASPLQATLAGRNDIFVAKLNAAGSTLLYSTYLGGGGAEGGCGIAVDSLGNAYVAGTTESTNFPTVNPYQPTSRGGGGSPILSGDCFVAKLNATGSALIYSTYLGGSGNEICLSLAVDSSGNAYVTGETDSTDFPMANSFRATFNGGSSDVFVTKLNTAGSALVYSTYLGGIGNDDGNAIAVDAAGNAYVTGFTESANFPTVNPLQSALNGVVDAFVIKLNTTGSAAAYSTYLGGSSETIRELSFDQ